MTITASRAAQHMETQYPRYLERLGSAGPSRAPDVRSKVFDARPRIAAGRARQLVLPRRRDHEGLLRPDPEETAKDIKGGWLHKANGRSRRRFLKLRTAPRT